MRDDYKIVETISRHGVPFVIIGGHAVNHHGYIRATEDADAPWVRSPLDWLRKMKSGSGRTKDLLDLDELPKE